MRRWYLIIVFCLLPTFAVSAQNNTFVGFDRCGHDSVALRTAIEADGWVFDDLIQFTWSPTCQYLSMRIPSRHGKPGKTIVWDAVANARVGFIEGFAQGGATRSWWDPSGVYLIVKVDDEGTYLWHVPSNRPMLLNSFECGVMDTYWDYEHQRLYATSPIEWGDNWCSPYIHVGGLRIYDLNTGEMTARYPNTGYTLAYEFSGDGRYIILSSYPGMVQVIDRTTGQLVANVDVDQGGGVNHSPAQIELSPDGRYLAIGMLYLRIWDLTALSADLVAEQPVYRHAGPAERILQLRFIDSSTIETTTWNGTQLWDVATGTQQQ